MNHTDEDKILNDLYQQANQEQPPKALDDVILQHAEQSLSNEGQQVSTHTAKNWRPWLAAASVVMVLPLIWLLTQNQELTSDLGQIQTIEPKPRPSIGPKLKSESVADDAGVESDTMEMEAFKPNENTAVNRAISSPPVSEAVSANNDLSAIIEQEVQHSITGRPIDHESLQANKELLLGELKAKKRTIKPSTMDPLMALEYEQFGRYLEQGKIEAADQLLTEMQDNWPEFDFEDMIYRLATAEINDQ